MLMYGGYGALIGFGCILTILILQLICGFFCSGVRSNSYAGYHQSSMGNVRKNSCFSRMQSYSMTKRKILIAFIAFTLIGFFVGIIYSILNDL
jgi:hypothetical protein